MRAASAHTASRPTLPSPVSIALAALAVAWSGAVLDNKLLGASLPGPGNLVKILPYAMPALVFALLLVRSAEFNRLDEAVAIWVTLVLLAVLLLPKVASGSLTPLAVPAIAVSALVARRWPAGSLLVVATFSASYGSLQAYWNFPVEKATALVLAGLWVASLAGLLFRGSRAVRPSLAMAVFGTYLLITALQVPLAANRHVAGLGFKDGAWFMLTVLLIAYAGWDRATHERIARAIVAVAAAAGLYALYRVVRGPSFPEYKQMAGTIFNFANGKLKPGGSFGSAQNMGTWMSAVVPFTFASILTFRGGWRLVAAGATALCVFAAIESQMRAGLVGIVIGLVVVLVLYQTSRGVPSRSRLGTTLVAAFVGIALITAGLTLTSGPSTHSYRALLNPTADPSFKARQYKWTQALRDLDTHPFGYGVGTASFAGQTAGGLYFQAGDTNVDNGFLKIALEQGLVIMGVLVIGLLAIQLALIRGSVRQRDRVSAGIVFGAAGTLASFLIVMVAEDATYSLRSMAAWLITGLGMAVVLSRRRELAAAAGRPR
jgi:hypothetical protein